MKQARRLLLILDHFGPFPAPARACTRGGLVARTGAPVGVLLGRFQQSRACCRSSVVEHSIGNGEVDSSILSGSTILLKSLSQARAVDCWGWERARVIVHHSLAFAAWCAFLGCLQAGLLRASGDSTGAPRCGRRPNRRRAVTFRTEPSAIEGMQDAVATKTKNLRQGIAGGFGGLALSRLCLLWRLT
jgi:hypothetical protein